MKTFKEAYGVLNQHAVTLRNQQEPNIDDLLKIVTESVTAYRVCKERIDAVEQALNKALGGVSATEEEAAPEPARKAPGRKPAAPHAQEAVEPDDDIPF